MRSPKEFEPVELTDNRKKKRPVKRIVVDDKDTKRKQSSNNTTSRKRIKRSRLTIKDPVELLLICGFIILLIVTVVLGFKLKKVKQEHKQRVTASIVVPVLGPDTNSEISVDVSKMDKGEEKEYVFKVSNNKDNNINPSEVVYAIRLDYEQALEVEVYKNEEENNVLDNDLIVDNKLISKEEQTDVYKVKIKAKKKIGKEKYVRILVIS